MASSGTKTTISVIVPSSPFAPPALSGTGHCLAALNVADLMRWWPGQPHHPHRRAAKVKAIQRSLDWKRVAQIAAYLLQREILDARDLLTKYFEPIYEPKAHEPGREWPPRVPKVIGFERSAFPIFSNVLIHVNGASITPDTAKKADSGGKTGTLAFDENSADLNFYVIDGQHRINGAYFALQLLKDDRGMEFAWDIPAEIFIDLDKKDGPPTHQAQIFIDVNFNQKRVDRSLVADLFPTARGARTALDGKERAQDLGRKLMLETGPLVGMVQIPGIKYGVKDVVTLATLNAAIEDILDDLQAADITSLDDQAEFIGLCLEAWFDATGRREEVSAGDKLDPDNVAYQGRVVVSFLTLMPVCIWWMKKQKGSLLSPKMRDPLAQWLRGLLKRAGLAPNDRFLPRSQFSEKGFLGSGGLARFRDLLWAASLSPQPVTRYKPDSIAALAHDNLARVRKELSAR